MRASERAPLDANDRMKKLHPQQQPDTRAEDCSRVVCLRFAADRGYLPPRRSPRGYRSNFISSLDKLIQLETENGGGADVHKQACLTV